MYHIEKISFINTKSLILNNFFLLKYLKKLNT
jgi:hypothetical protein